MKKIVTLFSAFMVIAFCANASQVDTLTIAQARVTQADGAPQDSGQIVRVSGTVYGPNSNKYPSTGSTFWIYNDTAGAGIKVYATHQYGYAINDGDRVTVQGYLSSYYGAAEIDLSDTAALDTIIFDAAGTPDTPVVINVTALSTSTYGQLVQVNNVNMTAATSGTWGSATKDYFTCKAPTAAGTLYIYVYEYTDTAMFNAPQPMGTYNIRGIGDYSLYDGEADANIDPRHLSDFIPVDTTTGVNNIGNNLLSTIIYPNPASTQLNVTLFNDKDEPATTRLFDVTGKEVLTETSQVTNGANNLQFNTANLTDGMYILEIRTAEKYMNTKIIVAK